MADSYSLSGIPLFPCRPPRGPKNDKGGFLIGYCKPFSPGYLPAEFSLMVRDFAMAPMLQPGDDAIFSTTLSPELGDCVLMGTIFGPEIRQYEPLSSNQWAGRALQLEYEDIHSTEEQCWLIAVLVGIQDASSPATEVARPVLPSQN